jgi:hypothetical protein
LPAAPTKAVNCSVSIPAISGADGARSSVL